MSHQTWKKSRNQKKNIHGKEVIYEIYQNENERVEIKTSNVDLIETITINPKRWLSTNPVIPLGKTDKKGNPLYKVVKLNENIAKLKKEYRRI